MITSFNEFDNDSIKRFKFPQDYKCQADSCPECLKPLTSFWIEEGNGINNVNDPNKLIIKSECHYFYNIQQCEYYMKDPNNDKIKIKEQSEFDYREYADNYVNKDEDGKSDSSRNDFHIF